MKKIINISLLFLMATGLFSCSKSSSSDETVAIDYKTLYPDFYKTFSTKLDFSNLPNYANQAVPTYIRKSNITINPITDRGALLGRVLFYDKNLSSNNTVSCASCHSQSHSFSDLQTTSTGVNGATPRHSMRLVNARFGAEDSFFWDERAATLEVQTTQPIQNHEEMGFSGTNGDQNLSDLMTRLRGILHYKDLFNYVYGSSEITETKI
jgi:cytochrome c peroxidase